MVQLEKYRERAANRIQKKEAEERTRQKARSLYLALDSLLESVRGTGNPYWGTRKQVSALYTTEGIYQVPIRDTIHIDIESRRSPLNTEQDSAVMFRIMTVYPGEDNAEVAHDTEEYLFCHEGEISESTNGDNAFTALKPAGVEDLIHLVREVLPVVKQTILATPHITV